jgi:hypothetical protein
MLSASNACESCATSGDAGQCPAIGTAKVELAALYLQSGSLQVKIDRLCTVLMKPGSERDGSARATKCASCKKQPTGMSAHQRSLTRIYKHSCRFRASQTGEC